MPLPYYVSPEQMMKDKAEYARKGISRGRSLVTLEYGDGILLVAENPSTLLHKISEIYDRIAFAGVGKYNEFENLRIAGIRHADVKGYSYSRGDVTAKALANAYSQALGNIFTQDIKPFEVEVLVAEVGDANGARNEIYHILYDGTIEDERNYAAMGGQSDQVAGVLKQHGENPKRLLLEANSKAVLAQFCGAKIEFKNPKAKAFAKVIVFRH